MREYKQFAVGTSNGDEELKFEVVKVTEHFVTIKIVANFDDKDEPVTIIKRRKPVFEFKRDDFYSAAIKTMAIEIDGLKLYASDFE